MKNPSCSIKCWKTLGKQTPHICLLPEVFLRQLQYDLSKGAQAILFCDICSAKEAVVELESAERVWKLPTVEFQEGGDGMDILSYGGVHWIQDRQAVLFGAILKS